MSGLDIINSTPLPLLSASHANGRSIERTKKIEPEQKSVVKTVAVLWLR
jgi:hypothetical protein